MGTKPMTYKAGISIEDESIVERVREPLKYGDSQSKRMAALMRVGLEVEKQMHMKGYQTHKYDDDRKLLEAARKLFRDAPDDFLEPNTVSE